MNYAVQMYEDFFIHEIPYYLNGERVSSDFTGGCIRLWSKFAKEFFEKAKPGDLIISYKDLDNFEVKEGFVFPVNKNEFYVRQRFNNPLRTSWIGGPDRSIDYIQHAGVDLAPNPDAQDLNVYNIYDGKVVKIVRNGEDDHGLGNVVIVEYKVNEKDVYALYAHLSEINPKLKEGDFIKKGEIIGKVGATAYGCNYWRIGEDGCDKNSQLDVHLHFEIKEKPVLESPKETKCFLNGTWKNCYGYVPHNPTNYGYIDPLKFLSK
jgi:murein DD-endopeptidase MepM/ murein hydrolase activator NlpD